MLHAAALDAMVGADVDPAALGLVEGGGIEAGIALVEHPAVCAVAFTGSQTAGLALQECANARERPIPFYGELGSINPVVALPEAFDGSNEVDLAQMLAASITLGSGQFCTSPGVVIVFRGADGSKVFVDALCRALAEANTHEMLTTSMRAGFDAGVERLKAHAGVETLVGAAGSREAAPSSVLVRASAQEFIRQSSLREEVFGPAAVLIEVDTHAEAIAVLESIGGTLTTTVWGAHEDTLATRLVVRAAMRVSGRVLFRGVPTGVAVTEAQQHGGPFPSSTQPFATSVGFAAIDRFLRPIALQESPQWIAEALGRRPV
jgi:NADP-dependent aldehyde dehydrogenase